jgi:hypothetical protein
LYERKLNVAPVMHHGARKYTPPSPTHTDTNTSTTPHTQTKHIVPLEHSRNAPSNAICKGECNAKRY